MLALVTMGEGWHNNHHHYRVSATFGFCWWEVDVTGLQAERIDVWMAAGHNSPFSLITDAAIVSVRPLT